MTTNLSTIDTRLEGIGHVLRDRTLTVPLYQRAYSWQREQVEAFWWDLRSAFDSKQPDYFLGTIVLTSGSGDRAIVIDGQQRLATTAMLFIAVRDQFFLRDDPYRAGVIEAQYVAARDLKSAVLMPRLTLNPEDDEFFRSWLLVNPSERPKLSELELESPSAKRQLEAFGLLSRRLDEHVKSAGPSWADLLIRWTDLLEYQARVIVVQVSNDADAFLIFETLNDRGLDLTVADLLKNYLFGLAGKEVSQVQRSWMSALETVQAAADEEAFIAFIRHYWSSLYGATRERELYARMRAGIRTREAAIAFTNALDDASPLYAGLLNGSHPVWERWPHLGAEAETLLRLGLEQNRPLALAAMQHFNESELRKLLRAMVAWSVRGLIWGGIGGGTTERYYAETATRISNGAIVSARAVAEELHTIIPTDEDFRAAFANVRVNKSRLALYYLAAIERELSSEPDAAFIPASGLENYSLQLALPRRADWEDWHAFDPENLGQWANRLGNQFLVPKHRWSPSVDPVERVMQTTALGKPCPVVTEPWSPQAVADRQAVLAIAAVRVWPRGVA